MSTDIHKIHQKYLKLYVVVNGNPKLFPQYDTKLNNFVGLTTHLSRANDKNRANGANKVGLRAGDFGPLKSYLNPIIINP